MGGPKIELARFRDLVAQGLNAPAIAHRLGVTRAAVYLFDEKHRTGLKKGAERCEAELIASGGTHAALAAWAAKWGTSHASARARWSRLKLPLAVQRRL